MRTDSWFLKLVTFAGMFFASGVVVDGGAGGDGGDGGSGGDGGQGGGDGEGEVEIVEEGDQGGEADEAEPEGEEPEDLTDDDEEIGDDGDDGKAQAARKATEKAVKAALEKLHAADPASAKLLRKTFYQQETTINGYRNVFPTPIAAREAYDLIEVSGGEAGIAKNKRDADSFASELNMIAKGEPAIIDELAKDAPQGLVKLTPYIVDRFRQVADEETVDRFAAGIMAPYFKDKGIIDGVRRAAELIGDGKGEDAYKKVVEIYNWLRGVESLAAKKAEVRDSGRNSEIDRREQELNQREQREYHGRVGQTVTRRMNTIIEKHLSPYLRDALKAKRGLTTEQRRDLTQGVFNRIARILERDDTYQDRFRELLETGDLARIDRYVSSQLGLKIRKAVRGEWQSRGFAGGNISRRATDKRGAGVTRNGQGGGGQGNGNRIVLGRKPEGSQIDWSKDKSRMRYTGRMINGIHMGEATLKDGKIVRWDWNRV